MSAYGAPLLDGAAAAFSVATSRLSAKPLAEKVTGALSGGLWASGALMDQLGNSPRNGWVTTANLLGGTAGALDVAEAVLSGRKQSKVEYSSAASWVANGTANVIRAAVDGRRTATGRLMQGASGVANIAAAGLAAAAAHASSTNQVDKAATLGTASSVLWAVGAAATLGAAWTAAPGSAEAPPQQPEPQPQPHSQPQ